MWTLRGLRKIETLRAGNRGLTITDAERWQFGFGEPDVSGRDDRSREHNLRLLTLVHHRDDGSSVEITLLRDPEWIADYGAHVGGTVLLDLPEMAAVGPAHVLAIDESPRIDQGPGRLITGTFHHTAADVYNLKVESEREAFGVTGTHPFWSVDRRAWVPAADLKVGETLKTLNGTTVVESIERRPDPEPVCNIEVESDHVYRVGTSGVLVHNASAVWTGPRNKGCVTHCPQLDGSTGFSTTPSFSTIPSSTYYGKVVDESGKEVQRYEWLPSGFKTIVTSGSKGSKASKLILPPGWDEQSNKPNVVFHRGHLLADTLGGPGRPDDGGTRNLIRQTVVENLSVMGTVEKTVRAYARQGKQVYYEVVAKYGSDPVPNKLHIRACAKVSEQEYDATAESHWVYGVSTGTG